MKAKRVLMIAFHFPPMRGSSGLQRSLRFANHLPEFGWDVRVLSVSPMAYPDVATDQLAHISPDITVRRTWCVDAARHLSLRGRYPQWLALPDRWSSWLLTSLPVILWERQTWRPDVIWTTFPIATTHLIGTWAKRLTGLPWVADFRDSMTEEHYPSDPRVRSMYRGIERKTIETATACVFTAEGTRRMYGARYPRVGARDWSVIPNGYDETAFAQAERTLSGRARTDSRVTVVHSGLLDPTDRDPLPFMDALADLRADGTIDASRVRVILRASGHDDVYRPQIERRQLADIVTLDPAIAYVDALAEMLNADGLLLFQGSPCNHQIPAKLYEHFRARRPILCITDPGGDTACAARAAGIRQIFPWHDRVRLATMLRAFFAGQYASNTLMASEAAISGSSRRGRTEQLAGIFDRVCG